MEGDHKRGRIGVFVCDCGTNIRGVVDVPAVTEFAKGLEGVVFADEGKWICSVDYLSKIKEYIAEHDLDRIVVACCTPRTHEPTFKSTIKEAGLNQSMLEFVSIREQSSWVHGSEPKKATEKAKDLVMMGVAKALLLEPVEEIRLPVGRESMIIGGGIAGMSAALALGDLGFKVILVEKEEELGGLLNKLDKVAPFERQATEIVQKKVKEIEEHDNITIFTNAEVEDISGYVGNFEVRIKGSNLNESLKVSTILVATGMEEHEPLGLFGYGKYPNIVTQLRFEEMLRNNELGQVNEVAFINCVNSRNDIRGCCNVGCMATIKNARAIKELNTDSKVYIFHRDLNIKGDEVRYLEDAHDKIDIAIRFPDDRYPEVHEEGDRLAIEAYDIYSGETLKLNADLVVLTTALRGSETTENLKGLLKVSTNEDGFFQEAHVKLRPLDFPNEGVYLGGCARSPKNLRETIEEALGAAMRAAIPMNRGYVETEGIVASIDSEECVGCELCAEVCAFGAVDVSETEPNVIEALCKGCGACSSTCPEEAIDVVHFTGEQITSQVDMALSEKPEQKIIAFCCHWCALGAADLAGVSRFEYPANVRIVRVMCSGRVDPSFVLKAFERGALGVLVAGCEFPTCHYINGNHYALRNMQMTKRLLEKAGIDPERLRLEWISASQGDRFARTIKEFTKVMDEKGPIAEEKRESIELKAAIECASDYRLRILGAKSKEFEESGNRYSERFTHHEIDRLIDEAVKDEFISKKMQILMRGSPRSIKELSGELDESPPKVLKCMQDMKHLGLVELDRLDGAMPIYRISPDYESKKYNSTSLDPSARESEAADDKKDDQNKIPDIIFDNIIIGSTKDALSKSLELAGDGKKVCVLGHSTSFCRDLPILSKEFLGYEEFDKECMRLVEEAYNNENITVLRNTVIDAVKAQEDTNELRIRMLSTCIDEEKCDNCGKCVEVCPVKVLDYDNFGLNNKRAVFQPYPYTDSMKYAISRGIPYCQASCPIMMDARGYIGSITDGDIERAYDVVRRTNPLPDICGRVCDHPCEATCARGYKDEALEVRRLKGFVTKELYETMDSEDKPLMTTKRIMKNQDPLNKVAIIGSGPAGLGAAYDLAVLGYPITIFEGLPYAGGMLKVGIPEYRLPSSALNKEIDAILNLGVDLKLNCPIGPDLSIDDLKEQGFKAIFIATGAHNSIKLKIEGEDLAGVVHALDFLKDVNLEKEVKIGDKAAVIGGGNAALDAARTVLRLGAKEVNILYRRTVNEMPASEEEIRDCEEEGIKIQYLVSPVEILGEEGRVKKMRCQKMELGIPDASGRRRPVPIEGSEFTIDVDMVIPAVGQTTDLEFLGKENPFEMSKRNTFMVDEETLATNIECVFAGGDAVTGPSSVINAIEHGKRAAKFIDQFLSGQKEDKSNIQSVTGENRTSEMELMRLNKNLYTPNSEPDVYREPRKVLDVVERITNFQEVERPYSKDEAAQEAGRCLSCRMCIGCGVCAAVCPKNAIDYMIPDVQKMVETREIISYPELVEQDIPFDYKDLYRNSLNAITPSELESMLDPNGSSDGLIIRPFDGEKAESIAFLNLPETEFITEEEKRFNALGLEFSLRLISHIKKDHGDIKLKLFTNTMESGEFPKEFEHLKNDPMKVEDLKGDAILVSNSDITVRELVEKRFEIEVGVNGEKDNFDLIVISPLLKYQDHNIYKNLKMKNT